MIFSGLVLLLGGMIGAQVAQLLFPLVPEEWFMAGKSWLPLWLPGKIFLTVLSVGLFAFLGLILSPFFCGCLVLWEHFLKHT